MKKTIALLLAVAGTSMAATEKITDQLVWNSETVAGLNGLVSKEATVVATLNWSYLTSDIYNDFFTLQRTGLDSYTGWDVVYAAGVGIYTDENSGTDLNLIYSSDFEWDDQYYTSAKNSYSNFTSAVDDEAVIVFTIAENGGQLTLNGYLYLWSVGAENPTCTSVVYQKWTTLPSDYIEFSPTLIKDVEVYTGITDDPELLATTLKNQVTPSEPETPAVPEPTTATLSLLALSALAARRRRR